MLGLIHSFYFRDNHASNCGINPKPNQVTLGQNVTNLTTVTIL